MIDSARHVFKMHGGVCLKRRGDASEQPGRGIEKPAERTALHNPEPRFQLRGHQCSLLGVGEGNVQVPGVADACGDPPGVMNGAISTHQWKRGYMPGAGPAVIFRNGEYFPAPDGAVQAVACAVESADHHWPFINTVLRKQRQCMRIVVLHRYYVNVESFSQALRQRSSGISGVQVTHHQRRFRALNPEHLLNPTVKRLLAGQRPHVTHMR